MTLYWKLLRDILRAKLPLLAVLAVTCLGVATFVATTSCYRTLSSSEARYYRNHRLPDAYLDLERVPHHRVAAITRDPAVRAVRGRVSERVQVFLTGQSHSISGRALSLPAPRRPVLGDISQTSGVWFSGPRAPEVLLNGQFAAAHGLGPGDRLRVMIRGATRELLVIGTAEDPEHAFLLPPGGGLSPDPARYAVLYLPRDLLATAAGLQGSSNQLLFSLHDSRPSHLRATLSRLERDLDAYGVSSSGPVRDWPAVQVLGDKISGLFGVAIAIPGVFLGMAILVLHVLLGRVVAQQRVALGTLRALGYTRAEVARHLAGFGLAVGTLGGLGGLALGHLLHGGMLGLYAKYFKLPDLVVVVDPVLYGFGLAVAVLAGLVGSLHAARSAASLEPAEAMRPPPPEQGAPILLERIPALWDRLPFSFQLVLRGIFRNPIRSGVSILSTFLGTSLIFAVLCLLQAVGFLMHHHFALTAHEDITISLHDPVSAASLRELERLPGTQYLEGQLLVAAELRRGLRQRRLGITGLPRASSLTTPLDRHGRPIPIPPRGLVLARRLAELLGVRPGESVEVRALVGDRRATTAPVIAVVDVYVGLAAWADRRYLARLLGESDVSNAALLDLQGSAPRPELLVETQRRPGISGLAERRRSLELFHKTVGEAQQSSLIFLVFIAGLLAFATILNNLLVSLDERQREVGTLRTLGYTAARVTGIFAAETLLLGGFGILLGLAGGRGLVGLLVRAFDTELFRFPVTIPPDKVLLSTAIMGAFLVAALIILRILIHRLDWLEALKVKE